MMQGNENGCNSYLDAQHQQRHFFEGTSMRFDTVMQEHAYPLKEKKEGEETEGAKKKPRHLYGH